MNNIWYAIIAIMICNNCKAQNLIPNGDFETYSSCPSALQQLQHCIGWINPTFATPDYFNQCATIVQAQVPSNGYGFQYARSGNGYIGLVTERLTSTPSFREYAEIQLMSTLTAGNCYYFEMYISLSEHSLFTSENFGVYFSDTLIDGVGGTFNLPMLPQLDLNLGLFTDTLNWVHITGNYTASGSENYIIMGNFNDSSNTTTSSANIGGMYPWTYLYIDDVSLSPCTGINEYSKQEINIYPSPVLNKLTIESHYNGILDIVMYDLASLKVMQSSFEGSTAINTEGLAKGIYLYEIKNKNGVIKKGKIIKE